MHALLAFTVLILAVPVRPDTAPKADKPATPALFGQWQVTGFTLDNKENGGGVVGNIFTFTPTEIHVAKQGKRAPDEDVRYAVDWSKTPATIDMAPKALDTMKTDGPPLRIEGILKIDGDVLTICFRVPGPGNEVNRPREFQNDAGTVLMRLRRLAQ